MIQADGTFSLDVSALTAPYLVYAEGVANGQSVRLYSVALTPGRINITPVTDFILRKALEDDPVTIQANWAATEAALIDEATLLLMQNTHNLVEGAGAASMAAAMSLIPRIRGHKTVLVMSGGNQPLEKLKALI